MKKTIQNKQNLVIIIPVFNEVSNIKFLFEAINKSYPTANLLFINDNSTDGTLKEIENNAKLIKGKIDIINRPGKMGLGSAYIDGFKDSLKKNYQFFLQMDADLSHNPNYIPAMIEKLNEADFVLGSRYVKNGGVLNWSWHRKLISFMGNFYAKTILQSKINDLTGGFNLWSRKVLEKIDLTKITSEGYCFQIELKNTATKAGFKFFEFPIVFPDRKRGKSKMNKKIVFEALMKVWSLR